MMLTELVRQTATSPTVVDLQSSTHPKCHPAVQGQSQQYHHHHQHQQQSMMMSGVMCGSILPAAGIDSNTFLPQTNQAVLDSHIRQNSTDSGLGGMGTTYSLPRSPEDYLSNVDEVDANDEDGIVQSGVDACFGQLNNMNDVTMSVDSDVLMPDLGDCVGGDLMEELDSTKLVYI